MDNDSEKHQAYATAIGILGICAFFSIMVKSCNDIDVEKEKTKQIQIIHNCNNINDSNKVK
jgi:hypothetical protein